jgi:small subunit ribosomal protein S20
VANIKSAVKRIQVAERNRLSNKAYKSAIKTLTKRYLAAVEQFTQEPSAEAKQQVQEQMSAVYSKIDKAVKRGALHRNNGANKKAKLARTFHRYVEPAGAEAEAS